MALQAARQWCYAKVMGATRRPWGIDWGVVGWATSLGLFAVFVVMDVRLVSLVLRSQPLGLDFLPVWTAKRVDPSQVYDFALMTSRQAWLYVGKIRPFVYPPSALLVLQPFLWPPYWIAYAVFMAASGGLYLWAGRRLGASWLMVVPSPVVLVALAGQLTFLIGGLVMLAITLPKRPWLAGLLFGVAGAIKPQLLVLLPVALAVEGNWRTFVATGVTATALVAASLVLGVSWLAWAQALPRFQDLVEADPRLVASAISPYAAWGWPALLAAVPPALAMVWLAFRRDRPAERVLALLGGAMLVSPYVMNYEFALIVPALLALDRRVFWVAAVWLGLVFLSVGALTLAIAMLLLLHSLSLRADGNENAGQRLG